MENHRFIFRQSPPTLPVPRGSTPSGWRSRNTAPPAIWTSIFRKRTRRCAKSSRGIARVTLHAPFNELFPCAIDPRARVLAADRFREAIALAKGYGAEKIVIHGGYNPQMYYPCWYTEQAALFWKNFLREDPGVDIVLENVLEEEPVYLLDIVRSADHPRLGLCLDIGHVNAYSAVPVIEWLKRFAPYLRHFHLHNNDGSFDAHAPLDEGSIPMKEFLQRALALCPAATFTLELQEDTARAARWLLENGFITKETNA